MIVQIKIMMLHVLLPLTAKYHKSFNNHSVFLRNREENER